MLRATGIAERHVHQPAPLRGRRHVAISCQFFNKTRRNLEENPYAHGRVLGPGDVPGLSRSACATCARRRTGPLFETMALRIEVIASHTGMTGVFKLRSADVCEVLWIEDGRGIPRRERRRCREDAVADGPMTEIRALSLVSAPRQPGARPREPLQGRPRRARGGVRLPPLDRLPRGREGADARRRSRATATARAASAPRWRIGEGLDRDGRRQARPDPPLGNGASCCATGARSAPASRSRATASGLAAEIPLPGLPDAESQLALPLVRRGPARSASSRSRAATRSRSRSGTRRSSRVLANQIAIGIDRSSEARRGAGACRAVRRRRRRPPGPRARVRLLSGTTTASSSTASTSSATCRRRSSGSSSTST